jgi:hypothetical protein
MTKLQAICKYVYIDERKSKTVVNARRILDLKDYQHTVKVDEEIKSANRIYDQTSGKLL